MQGKTWQDYGTPGTQALGHEEIEQAIARLAQVWDDARAHAQGAMEMTQPGSCKSAAIAATSRRPHLATTHTR